MTVNKLIALAVEPMRQDAIDSAEKTARLVIDGVRNKLAAHDGDFNAAYPYPHGSDRNYKYIIYTRNEARSLMIPDASRPHKSYIHNSPYYMVMDDESCSKYIKMQKQMASEQFDLYVAKLSGKVGTCDNAELTRAYRGVWGDSLLTVQKGEIIERWRTQHILNRSKLGLWFNQFPTRLLKK